MNKINFLVLSSAILLSTSYLEGFGIGLGPFDFEFGSSPRGYGGYYREGPGPNMLDDPICRAIYQQKKIEFIVVTKEKVSSTEKKITAQRITVEPYAYGFTKNGKPILRGTVTDEKMIKEVTIKFSEEKDQNAKKTDDKKEDAAAADKGEKGGFWGKFRSDKGKDKVETLNLARVRHIRVLEDTHFDAPKNTDFLSKDGLARVVCQVHAQIDKNQPAKEPASESKK